MTTLDMDATQSLIDSTVARERETAERAGEPWTAFRPLLPGEQIGAMRCGVERCRKPSVVVAYCTRLACRVVRCADCHEKITAGRAWQ